METKTYCDHCGKVLTTGDYEGKTFDIVVDHITADLCSNCFRQLCDYIYDFCKVETHDEESE